MRNVFLFIWKNHFVFLFALLEIFCLYLLVQNNRYHRAGFINSANSFSGNVMEAFANVSGYFSLRTDNDELAAENASLHQQQGAAFYEYNYKVFKVHDTIYEQQYEYIPAKVINNSVNKRNNYITLNRGSKQGIEPEMGVISPQGYVGIVAQVSEHFSVVISLLNKNASVSAKLLRSNYAGVLEWDGKDPAFAILNNIPGHVSLNQGDTVVTTSFSVVFPEGVMVGTIQDFDLNKSTDFYSIRVKLSTKFRNIHHVYVVKNLLKKEQLELEDKAENAE